MLFSSAAFIHFKNFLIDVLLYFIKDFLNTNLRFYELKIHLNIVCNVSNHYASFSLCVLHSYIHY